MPKFRKKPIVIEAIQWNGVDIAPVLEFIGDLSLLPRSPDDPYIHPGIGHTVPTGELHIPTLEGTMTAKPGDLIIRGVKGEIYPCKPDIFAATYELVVDLAVELEKALDPVADERNTD